LSIHSSVEERVRSL